MTRQAPPDPYVDAKLLGILLSGVFGQTRAECAPESRERPQRQESGLHRISPPDPADVPKPR